MRSDSDLYRICLTNGASFSASTLGGTLPASLDTQLFLFDAQGYGVYANDDWKTSRGSKLPAGAPLLADPRRRVLPRGEPVQPRSAELGQGEIFPDSFSRTHYPDADRGRERPRRLGHPQLVGRPRGGRHSAPTGSRSPAPRSAFRPTRRTPTVQITSPVDGSHVQQGADVVADFSCADEGGSGLASCVGLHGQRREARHEQARPGHADRDRARQGREPDGRDEHGDRGGPDQPDGHAHHAGRRRGLRAEPARGRRLRLRGRGRAAPASTPAWATSRTARTWTRPRSASRASR